MSEKELAQARAAVRQRIQRFGENLEEEERKAKAVKDAAFALAGVFGAFLLMKRLGKELQAAASGPRSEDPPKRRRRFRGGKRRKRRVSRSKGA